jgi:tetratricopeptide (TPR) repeat protein
MLRRRSTWVYLLFATMLVLCFSLVLQDCSPKGAAGTDTFAEGYLGDLVCRNCHEEAFQDWEGSHHDLAMQQATERTVLGDFSGQSLTSNGLTSRFFRRDGKFFVHTEGPDGGMQDFEVKYTFGVEPLQQYMVEFPGGRLQCLLLAWDTEEEKWFDLMPGQRVPPDDWLHWTKGSMTWNTMCADCHSTYLEKNYDPATDAFATEWQIIDVSCEACHGPGRPHLDYVNSPDYQRGERVNGSYMYLTADLSSFEQVEQCARCHVRRGPISEVFDHSGELLDHYVPDALSPGLYHADGQILDEVYVYGSFLQSKMYRHQVKCTNCHNAHSLELKFVGNDLCGQCHEAKTYDTPDHHFHPLDTESSQCVSCHMPGKYYMVNDFRRDHSFRIPRPDLSLRYETPNACNGCHDDQSAAWAARAVNDWYGPERPPHYSTIMTAAYAGEAGAVQDLIAMLGDTSQPEIVQASAVKFLGDVPTQAAAQAIVRALTHDDALIRYSAVNALASYPPEQRYNWLTPLLRDPVLAVRSHAAYQLADIPAEDFSPTFKAAFNEAKAEYESTLRVQADFPTGQVMQGQYYHRMGELERAAAAYREAIRQDPYLPQPYFNLANLYYEQGDYPAAIAAFREVIRVDSQAVDAYYSLGLLQAELGDLAQAAANLGQAARRGANPRYYYNWGLALQNLQRPQQAATAFQAGLALAPNDEALLYALAVLYVQQEQNEQARPIVERLLRINPQPAEYRQLQQMVE